MNPLQTVKQIRFLARARQWGSSGNNVFGSVHVTHGAAKEATEEFRVPLWFISPGNEVADTQLPDLVLFNMRFRLVCAVVGDLLGENAIIGANIADLDKSEGKGTLVVEPELKAVIKQNQNQSGIKIVSFKVGGERVTVDDELGYVVAREYDAQARCTDDLYYHPPIRFTAVDAVAGGDADLTWADPPTRFDSRGVRIRRAAGATPPATPTAGVLVADVALGVETFTDSPGAGQFSYAMFGRYTDTGAAVDEKFSDQEVGTTRTVTVT